MHAEVTAWFEGLRAAMPDLFSGKRVLELGSFDVNGSVRGFFEDGEYVGVDWREGPGVDRVSLVHDFWDSEPFDVVVSTEMLEHDPHWERSIRRGLSLLRLGGSMILTWVGEGRAVHEVDCSPEEHYYGNLSLEDVACAAFECASFHGVSGEAEGEDCRLFLFEKGVR